MVVNLVRYLNLWRSFAKVSLQREITHRVHFFVSLLERIGFAFVTIFTVEILFTHTDQIAGWSKGEVFLIYALFRLTGAIFSFFFRRNITIFAHLVNSGELDQLITKPVNTLFLSTSRIVSYDRISQIIIGIFLVYYATIITPIHWNLTKTLLFIYLLIIGALTRFIIAFCLQMPIFWLHKIENLERLEFTVFGIARFPRQAFPPAMNYFFSLIIPIMLAAAIPAEIFLNKLHIIFILPLTVFTLFLLWFTQSFFNFALKHYSSSSSVTVHNS